MDKLPLSVIILVHRADQRFIRCLESLPEAAEVLILDNESGIDWQQYPQLKVFSVPGQLTDFSQVRNQGLLVATQDWVLFLDSDEFLAPETTEQLPAILANERVAGVWIQRIDIYGGKLIRFGEVGRVYFLRLFRRSKGSFVRPVHEVVDLNGPSILASFVIYHQPHPNLTEFLEKVNRYAYLEASSRSEYSLLKWWFQLLVYPPAKFVSNYLFRLGLLDGWAGLVYAIAMSYHSLLVRVYLYEQKIAHGEPLD